MTNVIHGPTRRSGTIMVLFLILLPVLILFIGFSVDYAYWQKTRSELRRATDLAAKAAAGKLSDTDNQSLARQTAQNVAQLNLVNGNGLSLSDEDVVFGSSTRQANGTWTFTAGGTTQNAVRVLGRRTSDSLDGLVASPFGALYGYPAISSEYSATAAFVNVDVCLVLDRSSSMKLPTSSPEPLMGGSDPRFCNIPAGDSRWVALTGAVDIFLAQLDATQSKERVATVTFASDYSSCGATSTKTSVEHTLTESTATVRAAMTAKSSQLWNGMTDISAGITRGTSVLFGTGSRSSALKFLIVLTDGRYTEANPSAAAQAAVNAGASIYTITFSAGANQTDMQNIAAIGNGRHYHADTPGQLNAAFRELGGSLAALVQ